MKQKVIDYLQSIITSLEDPSVEIINNSFSAEEKVDYNEIYFRGRGAPMLTGNKDISINFTLYDPKSVTKLHSDLFREE